jgi:hypothetical protein
MSFAQQQKRPTDAGVVIPTNGRGERLELADFSFTRTPSGQCSAQVTLEWDGQVYSGRALGQSSTFGDFRVCAEATLRALEEFTKEILRFELLGIKHIRAFDSDLLIVSVAARAQSETTRLVGCCLAETDTRRSAAMAVLNATNRLLGHHIKQR